MLLRRRVDGRIAWLVAGSLTAQIDYAAQPVRSVRSTLLPSLLETFTDPLSRHPELTDVHRFLNHAPPRTFSVRGAALPRCARRCQRTGAL
jgi:hypothetical protein